MDPGRRPRWEVGRGFFLRRPLHTGMETIEVVTPAAGSSVDTDTIMLHLRLNDDSEIDLLQDWLYAADDLFTRNTGYILVQTTLRLKLDGWPHDGIVYIPRHPVTSITSVEYLDDDGTWHTLAGCTFDTASVPARVVLPTSLPTTHATQVPKVRVTFAVGHADPADCPKLALVAVKMLTAFWYGYRESHGEVNLTETPMGWRHVCDQYKTGVLGNWNEVG